MKDDRMKPAGPRRALPALLLLLLPLCLPVAAQIAAPVEPPAAVANASSPHETLESEVAARSAAISADSALDPATRDSALERLKEAQQALQAAAGDRAEAARLAAEREAAPGLLDDLAADVTGADAPAETATAQASENRSDLSLSQLEIATSEAENFARAARQAATQANDLLSNLRSRRPLIGTEIAAARETLADIDRQLLQIGIASEQVKGTGSEELLAKAQRLAGEARLALLEQYDGNSADLREQLLEARARAAARELRERELRLQQLRAELAGRRVSDAVAQSSAWQDSPLAGYDRVAAIARSNVELAAMYTGADSVTHRIEQAQRETAELEHSIAQFDSDSSELRSRLDGLGRSFAAGILIRHAIDELPDVAYHEDRLVQLRVSINETQLRIVSLANELQRLNRDLTGEIEREVSQLPGLPEADRNEATAVVGRLLKARRRIARPLLRDFDELSNRYVELRARERDLLTNVQDMDLYLHARQPWVRNGRRVTIVDIPAAFGELATLPTAALWAGSGEAILEATERRPGQTQWVLAAIVAAVATLFALSVRRRRLSRDATLAATHARPAIVLATAVISGLACLTISLSLGWWLTQVPDAPAALLAFGRSLVQLCAGVFVLGFAGALFARRGGAGSVKPALAQVAGRVRVGLGYLTGILVLLVAGRVVAFAGTGQSTTSSDLGARLCLLLAAMVLAVGLHVLVGRRLRGPALQGAGLGSATLWFTYALVVTIPVVFTWLLVQGFTIAGYDLTRGLVGTLLVLVIAGTVRVLFLEHGQAVEAQALRWSSLREARLDLFHVLLTIVAAAALLWMWRDLFTALRYLQDIPLWTSETVEGLKTVTVANLLSCLTVLGGTLIAFWALPLVFGTVLSDAQDRTVGTRYAVVALVRYTVLLVGLAAAFSLLNIGWSKLQWMAAGLSVGLGLGLQETAANFFSGLTLLSERSIRVGDLVTVGDKTGTVQRIKVRATTVEDFDGREIVIPNTELVTTQVTNWTLTNSKRRLQIVVGVAYGSDVALVVQKLLEAAGDVAEVLSFPPPQAVFEQFGDSVLQFRLYVWINTPQHGVGVNHALHVRIDQLFRENGIAIDFPQQDVHLFPKGPIEVRLRTDTP